MILQSSIQAEGFRSLREGEEVEYDVEAGPDGRTKAINVTGPGGAAPQVWPEPLSCSSCAHSTVWPGCSTDAANALLLPDPKDQALPRLHSTTAGIDADKQPCPASALIRPTYSCTTFASLHPVCRPAGTAAELSLDVCCPAAVAGCSAAAELLPHVCFSCSRVTHRAPPAAAHTAAVQPQAQAQQQAQ